MPAVSFHVTSFLGGELSQYAQGRSDRPDYRMSFKTCINAFPVEIGAWTPRPGTQYAGWTRGGLKGRVIKFDFEQSNPVTMEFTDGYVRFRNGPVLITTNDSQTVSAISTANPAVVQTASAHGWSTGNTVIFPTLGDNAVLQNRQFLITVTDSTHFSLQDALTGANIDGSVSGTFISGTVARVHELTTVFGGGAWSTLRSVQAETTNILLQGNTPPQALTVSTLPSTGINAQFSITQALFNDGPYLDPFTNNVQVTPGAKTGIVTMTLSFPAYSATTAYQKGAFVVSSGSNYVSLQDQNVNNTPASSPTFWATTSIGAAINNGAGLSNGDVGRLVRLFSEPAVWAAGTTYAANTIVTYNPSGIPGAETYWNSLVGSNTGNVPGTDTTHWALVSTSGAALWTWGKITSLSNAVSGATGSNIGTMTGGGGLPAAFDGNLSQNASASATLTASGTSYNFNSAFNIVDGYVGKNYSGGGGQVVDHVVVYPATDTGLGSGTFTFQLISNGGSYTSAFTINSFTLKLRGKASAPSSASDGTVLGTVVTGNTTAPVTITSNDTVTSYNYVWVETIANVTASNPYPSFQISYTFTSAIGQVTVFNPVGAATGSSFNVEILGPALLYTNLISVWRLGAFSAATGYPTCGCYHEGRLWLGGAIANRWDACVSNGIVGSTINFAPTDQYGVVSASSAISYVLNSDSVNPIYWMEPALEGIVMGTENAEWLTQAPTSGPISPTNVVSRRMTRIGSQNVQPRKTEHTLLFVKRYGVKIMEYFPDVISGRYSAPNIADKAQHITGAGIVELAYTEAATPIAWMRDNNNALSGITYKRNTLSAAEGPTYAAFHRHALGTGRTVESISSGPSVGGTLDALTMVTSDALVRHVEVLTDVPSETAALASSWYLDDAVNPFSTSTTNVASGGAPYGGLTINGLWHLNGKTVQVFAGGLDLGDLGDLCPAWSPNVTYSTGQFVRAPDGQFYTSAANSNKGYNPVTNSSKWTLGGTDYIVTNGSITVPYADGISAGPGAGLFTAAFAAGLSLSQIVIGATYNSDAQLVKLVTPADSGSPNGPAFGKKSRVDRMIVKAVNAAKIMIGTDFNNMTLANFSSGDGQTPMPPLSTFTGTHVQEPNDDYSVDRTICWRIARPFPGTIVAVGANLETQDR